MKYKKNKECKKRFGYWKLPLAFSIFIVTFSFFVAAFSVGSFSAINVAPGETVETTFSLMNTGEDAEDVVIEIVVDEGAQYFSFPEGTRYNVPAGTTVSARVSVSIPSDASVGDSYPAKITFNAIEGGVNEGDTVDIVFGYSKSFNINVITKPVEVEEPTPPAVGGNFWLWLIAIIILIIIIWLVMKRKKKSEGVPGSASVVEGKSQ